jgi:DNA-binding response OmpR family regulator
MPENPSAPLIVLCIPGPWQSQADLVQAIARGGSGYLFAGQVLMNMETRQTCELEFQAQDDRMQAAFRAAGPHWVGTPEMQRIADHSAVVYLVADGGVAMTAEALMQAAAAVLEAGGLGVKVESSGVAHAPADWLELCAALHLFSAHRAYVLYVTGPQVYSCGMHNLGLRDAIVDNDGDTAGAVELLRAFTHDPCRRHRRRPAHQQPAGRLDPQRPARRDRRPVVHRDDAEAALAREPYDVVLLDIELGRERHAGVALINEINKRHAGVPVLVVSAMPAAIYRSIMKALDAWDYLQKTTFEEADFIETFLEILRVARERKAQRKAAGAVADELALDPLWQRTPTWRGERINLPLTAQRILATLYQRRGEVVSYDELFDVVKSGRNRDNVRKHVSTIRDAFREVDPNVRRHRERADARLPLGRPGAGGSAHEAAGAGAARLEAPRLGWASFRRRMLFRGVFLLLALATLALAVVLLQDEKERSWRNYQQGFRKTQADLMARLRHPAGLLALLNPQAAGEAVPLRPLVLPYPSLDVDDPSKALQAVEQAGCPVRYPDDSTLCAAIGNNPYAGGFIYLVGSFRAGDLVPREPGNLDLELVHRARIRLEMRGELRSLGRALRAAVAARRAAGARPARRLCRGRPSHAGADAKPLRDFRGWLWQSATCSAGGEPPDCPRRVFYSIRLPVEAFRAALAIAPIPTGRRPTWTASACTCRCWRRARPAAVRQQRAGRVAPPMLADLGQALQPGEVLTITRQDAPRQPPVVVKGRRPGGRPRLAADPAPDRPAAGGGAARAAAGARDHHHAGRQLRGAAGGDPRGSDRGLGVIATRMSWYVAAMLGAIVLAWLLIEVGLIRRIACSPSAPPPCRTTCSRTPAAPASASWTCPTCAAPTSWASWPAACPTCCSA